MHIDVGLCRVGGDEFLQVCASCCGETVGGGVEREKVRCRETW